MIDLLGEGTGAEPGAAAEIDAAPEECRLLRGDANRDHRLEQKLWRAIAEIAKQRGLEARRILVEQRLHIALRHLAELVRPEPHQVDGCAMAILRIGFARLAEGGDRGLM